MTILTVSPIFASVVPSQDKLQDFVTCSQLVAFALNQASAQLRVASMENVQHFRWAQFANQAVSALQKVIYAQLHRRLAPHKQFSLQLTA